MSAQFKSVSSVRAALLDEIGSATRLHFVNTRLILTVGVDLNGVSTGEAERANVEKAVTALQKMGFLKGEEVRRG